MLHWQSAASCGRNSLLLALQVHYALQLPPLRYPDQLQPPGQQYVPLVVPSVGGGGTPVLPPPQPSSQIG